MPKKGLLFFSFLFLLNNANALETLPEKGVFIGIQGGHSITYYKTNVLEKGYTIESIDRSGTASRIHFGYSFNRYLAAESGIVYFKKPRFRSVAGDPGNRPRLKNNVFYVGPRLSMPLKENLAAYINAGIGYRVRGGVTVGDSTALEPGEFFNYMYGVGTTYRFHDHWYADATWIESPSTGTHRLPRSDFYGLGFIYRF